MTQNNIKTLFQACSFSLWFLIPINSATAQIIPDGTLGVEKSVVSPINGFPGDLIVGGAQRGGNLFHSFKEFNVDVGRGAYFINPNGVQNIFSRVTGSNRSNILGTLGVLGNANLFLINPNGIIFGSNAQLDVKGSFLATTASSVVFNNGFEFSATNPQTPPLLTVDIPIGLRFRENPGSIVNQSVAGLEVPLGSALALVGGNVTLDQGNLSAPGGRVELGGLSQAGTVGLNSDGSLSFPQDVQRADVSLIRGASVDVIAGGGGSIAINARNVDVLTGSVLLAGIGAGLGSVGAVAGDIKINATGDTKIADSYAFTQLTTRAVGKGGDIKITTGSLSVTGGASLSTITSGQGDAGSVNIYARDTVTFDGIGSNGLSSGAYSGVGSGAVGKGGDIKITTGSLSVTGGALLITITAGQGDAGSVNIYARDTVTFDGVGSNGFSSTAYTGVGSGAVGKGGSVSITTGSLSLTQGAQLNTSTFGKGDAGSVNINARDTVTFDGVGSNGLSSIASSAVGSGAVGKGGSVSITTGSLSVTGGALLTTITAGQGDAGSVNIYARDAVTFDGVGSNGLFSSAYTAVGVDGMGKGGDIKITTGSLSVTGGAQLSTSTLGKGDAGSLNITTGSLSVTAGAALLAATEGQGDAGSVNINARDTVTFDGVGSNGAASGAFTAVGVGAVGKGGGINITTGSLSVTGGAELLAATEGQGDAGSVNIYARDTVAFDGGDIDGFFSGAYSSVESGAVGKGGGISITTGSLSVTGGAKLSTSTFGKGDAGSVNINARDTVTFDGVGSNGLSSSAYHTGVFSSSAFGAVGSAGSIRIAARSLSLNNAAQLNSSSTGSGAAGSIEVTTAKDIRLDNGAFIFSNTTGGQGNITLLSRDLFLRHNSNIATNATGTATGGNITINTGNLVAVPKENSDISANAEDSFGGRISITAAGIFGTKFRPQLTPLSDITASSKLGPQFNGTVQLNILSPDPSRGLSELPQNVVDPASQIAQNPCTRGKSSEFTITGRGGLPPNPNEALSSDAVGVGLVDATSSNQGRGSHEAPAPTPKTPIQNLKSTIQNPIVPALGWIFNDKGQVVLTAYNPAVTQPQRPWRNPGACHAL